MGKYILLIEPSRLVRNILGVHFQLAGHNTMEFATYGLASEAIPIFEHHLPDLVFVALHTAQPESCALLKHARAHFRDTTLVALLLSEERTHRPIQTALQETHAIALIKPFKIQDALALCHPGPLPQQPYWSGRRTTNTSKR